MTQDQELFELCKEAYEKTGWDGTSRCYAYLKNPYIDVWAWEIIPCHEDNIYDVDEWHPLYDSDYLLEKLSGLKHTIYLTQGKKWVDGRQVGVWAEAQYSDSINAGDKGDTPLKALLKLAIALDDAGVKL